MVKIRQAHSLSETLPGEAQQLLARIPALKTAAASVSLREALETVLKLYTEADKPQRVSAAVDVLETLLELQLDEPALIAGLLCIPLIDGMLEMSTLTQRFGPEVANILNGVQRMDALRVDVDSDDHHGGFVNRKRQGENLRRMLVALIDDPRVALVKLAERVQALRAIGANSSPAQVELAAREAMDIYAPLAHRLGVGQIKWELEDLSFRRLHAPDYHRIAALLAEKRSDRERFIAAAIARLDEELRRAGIDADISGRPKHLYSIWKKMQRKGIDISEVYDVRALRLLVSSVAECYAALGLVHGLWRNLPGEFDDYIANPKPNGYKSLHTAVIGEGGKVLEVQIRTREMHQEAELGICAHWQYKGSDRAETDSGGYEEKIGWLRQVLGWGGELDADDLISEHLRREVGADRVYVLTPDGHVVDLPAGATPVDFAYHVHSELGHRCRGARVDGRMVSLDYALKSGERVEIIRGKTSAPNRDWLLAGNEFVHTTRARSKIRHWFREQNREQLVNAGRAVFERELKRLALPSPQLPRLARTLGFAGAEDMLVALGSGDLGVAQLLGALSPVQQQPDVVLPEEQPRATARRKQAAVAVAGIDNLLTQFAGCCRPLPGEAIAGYVTGGRGVSVHRRSCAKLAALAVRNPARLIEVEWQDEQPRTHAVDVRVVAQDRPALLKDLVNVLGNERVNILHLNTRVDRVQQLATVQLTLEIASLAALGRIMEKLGRVSGVISVRRHSE